MRMDELAAEKRAAEKRGGWIPTISGQGCDAFSRTLCGRAVGNDLDAPSQTVQRHMRMHAKL
jgi:hypothetical protein